MGNNNTDKRMICTASSQEAPPLTDASMMQNKKSFCNAFWECPLHWKQVQCKKNWPKQGVKYIMFSPFGAAYVLKTSMIS